MTPGRYSHHASMETTHAELDAHTMTNAIHAMTMKTMTKMKTTTNEDWKRISDTRYEVSNLGNIRHIKIQRNLRMLNNGNSPYWSVRFKQDGYEVNVRVHVAVAKAFVPNPGNMPYVIHINKDLHDNRAENLQWSLWCELHHQRTVPKDRPTTGYKVCTACHRELPVTSFAYHRYRGIQSYCKDCQREYNRKHFALIKASPILYERWLKKDRERRSNHHKKTN